MANAKHGTSYNRMKNLLGEHHTSKNDTPARFDESTLQENIKDPVPDSDKENFPKQTPESSPSMTAILTACLGKKTTNDKQPR
ncbi:hypothetical protein [Legionella impletisoli]|uniref:Uncharacterized protein n=1 Tax=Legionella impletisoli TaxID=343510 RepID=A0A917NDA2_9GAMM|nr:hypothetical protein [Legionella impletisoli]GGI89965.1 hypothetical protein GCM10007966_18390 [Legionella impletisoli]